MRSVPATELKDGMRLALPMGRTATVTGEPKVGRDFVSFRTEHGKSRVGRYDEVLIEDAPPPKSYRTVPMAPTDAYSAAAAFVEREWGGNYRMGLAGVTDAINGKSVYAFQVLAIDGSRFLVWATRHGETGTFMDALQEQVAAALDVEVN